MSNNKTQNTMIKKFHILYASTHGSITIYDVMAKSRRFAEIYAQEALEENYLKDDFGHSMKSFIVLDQKEFSNLPESFFEN